MSIDWAEMASTVAKDESIFVVFSSLAILSFIALQKDSMDSGLVSKSKNNNG